MSTTKSWDYKPYGLGTKDPFKYPAYTETPIGGGGKTPIRGNEHEPFGFKLSTNNDSGQFLTALEDEIGSHKYTKLTPRGMKALENWWDEIHVNSNPPSQLPLTKSKDHFKANGNVECMTLYYSLDGGLATIDCYIEFGKITFKKMVYVSREALKDHRAELEKLFEGAKYAAINVSTARIGVDNVHGNEYRLKDRISSVSPHDLIEKGVKTFAKYSKVNTLIFYLGLKDPSPEKDVIPSELTGDSYGIVKFLMVQVDLDSERLRTDWYGEIEHLKRTSGKIHLMDTQGNVVLHVTYENGVWTYSREIPVTKIANTNNTAPIQLVININNPQYAAALVVLFIALFFVRG